LEIKRFKRTLRQVFILPVAACLLLAIVLVWQIRRANDTVGLIELSDQRIALAIQLEKLVVDEETGLRGYQTTSDPRFLKPYYDAEVPILQTIAKLKLLTIGHPEQAQSLQQFIEDHKTWHQAFAEPLIATLAAGGHANDIDLNLQGVTLMDAMRTQLKSIASSSEQRSEDRINEWHQQTRHLILQLITLTLTIGLLIGFFVRSRLETVSATFRSSIESERQSRTALIANEKLAVAGRLAATIAHEIHNPLDSVANLLYLLQHQPTEDESKEYLQMAQAELERVTQISRAMLGLYRESKAPVVVNLKEMLDDLLLLMHSRFLTLGVTVSADLPPQITVEGFPAELRQVFTNLILNAAEAAGKGGIVLVRAYPRATADNDSEPTLVPGALVEISDNGPGILPEHRERLFQPFFTTKGENGTGLGLWVSQGIINKHSGTIDISSHNEGSVHGTVVTVFLANKPVLIFGKE
jgi:signal transduction histidine kinase